MLQNANHLHGNLVQATDGLAGTVDQLLFDDITWCVRHVVVRVGNWWHCRRVLLPPAALIHVSRNARTVYVALTRAQIAACPDLDTDPPVAEQHLQAAIARPPTLAHWPEPSLWIAHLYAAAQTAHLESNWPSLSGDRHLRSTRHITGYAIAARDATFGRIADVALDDMRWAVHSLIAETRLWWPRQVAIPRCAVRSFDWAARLATVDMWREAIEQLPDGRALIQQQFAPPASRARRNTAA